MPAAGIVVITGTGTAVGKTTLTGLLLTHLRRSGSRALAMKPFSSGKRTDSELLCALQPGEASLDEINPFHFSAPVAPWLAARRERRSVTPAEVTEAVERVRSKSPLLLIEGAGGLLSPLADGLTAIQWAKQPDASVIIVGRNQLGVINDVLLTAHRLTPVAATVVVVLMQQPVPDESASENVDALRELLPHIQVFELPFLRDSAMDSAVFRRNEEFIKKDLAQICRAAIFTPLSDAGRESGKEIRGRDGKSD